MSYWLLKTEPGSYSYDDLARDRKTVWDGVSNNLALKHLRSMKKGDLAFVYHTGGEKSLVGVAEIATAPYPDPGAGNPRLVVVDIKAKKRLKKPVSLSSVKERRDLRDFALVRLPRLSVMPVTSAQWKTLLSMAG